MALPCEGRIVAHECICCCGDHVKISPLIAIDVGGIIPWDLKSKGVERIVFGFSLFRTGNDFFATLCADRFVLQISGLIHLP